MPAFGALTKPLIDRPGNATEFATPGCFSAIADILPDHRFGAIERRRVGQLRERDEVLLVLRRHEARRHPREAEHGQRRSGRRRATSATAADAQHARHAAGVARRRAREERG